MAEPTYTCQDCGETCPRKPGRGRIPKRCPEHAAIAKADSHRRARRKWVSRNPELDRQSKRDHYVATRDGQPTVKQRDEAKLSYTCSDCGVTAARKSWRGRCPQRCVDCKLIFERARLRECYEVNGDEQRARSRQWARDNKAACAARGRRRYAQIRATRTERIIPWLIFERDEWNCGFCRQPVNKWLVYPDPMSPSLDHIHPLTRGGTHTHDNVQCVHWVCNVRKNST